MLRIIFTLPRGFLRKSVNAEIKSLIFINNIYKCVEETIKKLKKRRIRRSKRDRKGRRCNDERGRGKGMTTPDLSEIGKCSP